jgi:serine/threonine protein kinase
MSYQFLTDVNLFQDGNQAVDPFIEGYSVQSAGNTNGNISSGRNDKLNEDIVNTIGDFNTKQHCIISNNWGAVIPVRFVPNKNRYQLFNPSNYVFQSNPADKFIFYQVGPNANLKNMTKDDFLDRLRESNKSFSLGLLHTERVTNNEHMKIFYNGVSSNTCAAKKYSMWGIDDKEKIKKVVNSVNLLDLLQTQKQLFDPNKVDNTEIVIGSKLASAQESLQNEPQIFFESLIEVLGKGPNAILFYEDIRTNRTLTQEQLLVFEKMLDVKGIDMTKENINKSRQAKNLGIKVKHLEEMENKLDAKISKIEKMDVGGCFGTKFKVTFKDINNNNEKEKFIKVQPASSYNSMTFEGDILVKESFLEKQAESILIPDFIHVSKKIADKGIVTAKTGAEFLVSDFIKENINIFLENKLDPRNKPLNPRLSTPEDRYAISQQLMLALQELHDKNIYHYDLKAGNLVLNKNKKLYIIDLSTATKEIKGVGKTTLSYSPPEYLNHYTDNSITPTLDREKHDIWSLGVILLSLQVGREVDCDFIKVDKTIGSPTIGYQVSAFKDQDSIDKYIDGLNITPEYKDFFKSLFKYDLNNRPNLDWVKGNFPQSIALEQNTQAGIPNLVSPLVGEPNLVPTDFQALQPNTPEFSSLKTISGRVMATKRSKVSRQEHLSTHLKNLKLSKQQIYNRLQELKRVSKRFEQQKLLKKQPHESIQEFNFFQKKVSKQLQQVKLFQQKATERLQKLELLQQQASEQLKQVKVSQQQILKPSWQQALRPQLQQIPKIINMVMPKPSWQQTLKHQQQTPKLLFK